MPLAEYDKDHLGPAAALRWAKVQALQAVVPDDPRRAALLLWSPMIGASPRDNFDDIEAAIRTAVIHLDIGMDRELLICYFTCFENDDFESAEGRSFLQSIEIPLKDSEPYRIRIEGPSNGELNLAWGG